jgi:hypothetical protein
MQLFPDRFDFWVVDGDSDRPTRIDPESPVPDVTAYDYSPGRRRLALDIQVFRMVV